MREETMDGVDTLIKLCINLHVAYGFLQTYVVNGGVRKISPNSTKNIFGTTEPIKIM